MIIFLYGPDSYRRNKNLKELISAYRNKHREIDLLITDLEETPDDWLKVRDFLNQPSMFVESKVAVVKESGIVDKKEWRELLKSYLKTPKIFIIISDSKKPTEYFNFLLKKPVESKYFEELKDEKLAAFLKRELLARNLIFSAEAWRYFFDYISSTNDRTWLAVNELEKIFLAGLPQPISLKDLREQINWLPRTEVYLLTRQLATGRDFKTRLGFLEKLFFQKEDSARIFNSLVYQVRGDQILKLADYDVSIKSGGLEYEEALLDFCLSF